MHTRRAAPKTVRQIAQASSMLLFLFGALPAVFGQTASPFTWSLSSDVTTSNLNNQDSTAGIFANGSGVSYVYPDNQANFYVLTGSTLDNLAVTSTFNVLASKSTDGFTQPNGDDAYWSAGVWVDPGSGTWYAPVHIEFNYGSPNVGYNHFRRIGLAVSTNGGSTWTYAGDIATSANPTSGLNAYAGSYFDFGVGDPRLFIDSAGGYAYMIWLHEVFNKSTGTRYTSQRISRSPLSSKMAPGSWRNWYDGSWNEPSLGGLSSDVPNMPNDGIATIFFSTYLNEYVQIGFTQDSSANIITGVISTATSLDTQNWTPLNSFSPSSRVQWYNNPVDASTNSQYIIGSSFRLYSASSNVLGASKYMTVNLSSGTTNVGYTPPSQLYPTSPAESIRDGNSGWQTDPQPGTTTVTSVSGVPTGLTLSWTAVPSATGYKIEYGTASGDYGHAADVVASATTYTLGGLAPSTTYYVRVRAFTSGAFGPMSSETSATTLPPGGVTLINDTDSGLTYIGSHWVYSSARGLGDYDDDVHANAWNGEAMQYSYVGVGIDYITEKSADQGDITVNACDGAGCTPTYTTTVNAYTSGPRQVQQVLYSVSNQAQGPHTIQLVKSSGTVLVLDALRTYAVSTINDTDPSITYSGSSWVYSSTRGLGDYLDDVHAASQTGDYAQYTFTGTGISYVSEKSSDQGNVDVSLCDGPNCTPTYVQTVSGYTSGPRQAQQELYTNTSLAAGVHTIRLTHSTGNAIAVDAFIVSP